MQSGRTSDHQFREFRVERTRYPSEGYKETRGRRLRRISRSAIPELREGWQAGRISLRRYDLLSRLPASRQRKELAHLELKETANTLAAKVIHSILTRKPERVDLTAIALDIVASIRQHL
jgi:hypothetical protein